MKNIKLLISSNWVKITLIGLGILTAALISLLFTESLSVSASPANQGDKPKYNWTVTENMGIGVFTGVGEAQYFRVNHPTGWEVFAYCLQPGEASPPVGGTCELLEDDVFWCGDDYQDIQLYQVLQEPQPPPTSTSTSTPTSTPTATSIPPTQIPTRKPSPTPTPRPKMGGGDSVQTIGLVRFAVGLSLFTVGILLAVFDWRKIIRRD
jgi:hypothetical protein